MQVRRIMSKYRISIEPLGKQHELVTGFRKQILMGLYMNPYGAAANPLECAFHGLCKDNTNQKVLAWNEWFFYDQLFHDYSEALYCKNSTLEKYAPLDRVIHHRSSYVLPEYRRSFIFFDMVLACATGSKMLGAKYCTVSTLHSDHFLIQLYLALGFKELGLFPVEGRQHRLLIVPVEDVLAHARLKKAARLFQINELHLRKTRSLSQVQSLPVAAGK